MKKRVFTLKNAMALLMLATIATSCKKNQDETNLADSANSQALSRKGTAAKPVYELVWSDDFTGGKLDSTKWTVVKGNQHVNNELQAYSADALSFSDRGGLYIQTSKIATDGQAYTSGKITTAGKFSFQYGRIEARISNANAAGLTSEFTLQGIDYPVAGMPKSGEIDIMQHKNNDTKIYGGIQWDNEGYAVFRGTTVSYPSTFTIYAVEWDTKEIRYYVENVLYQTVNIADNVNSTEEFHKPFFINLNVTVGGNFAGDIIAPYLPISTGVSYVKVYKLAGSK